MLRKNSFKNQAAVIVSLDPDYQSEWWDAETLQTRYIKFTTQDAHNFVAGTLITINGLYAGSSKGVRSAVTIVKATITRVLSPTVFVILLPDTFNEPNFGGLPMNFGGSNYYVNSSGLGSKSTWGTADYISANGWDLYKANQQVHAYTSDGSLGAYKLSYGDTV